MSLTWTDVYLNSKCRLWIFFALLLHCLQPRWRNWYSAWTTGWTTEEPWSDSEQKQESILFSSVPSNLLYSCADLLLLSGENFYTTWWLRNTLKVFFVIFIIRIFTMKMEKFQLLGKNSLCTGAFQLHRRRATAQIRGNIAVLPSDQTRSGDHLSSTSKKNRGSFSGAKETAARSWPPTWTKYRG
jgi:hypothetical protein